MWRRHFFTAKHCKTFLKVCLFQALLRYGRPEDQVPNWYLLPLHNILQNSLSRKSEKSPDCQNPLASCWICLDAATLTQLSKRSAHTDRTEFQERRGCSVSCGHIHQCQGRKSNALQVLAAGGIHHGVEGACSKAGMPQEVILFCIPS